MRTGCAASSVRSRVASPSRECVGTPSRLGKLTTCEAVAPQVALSVAGAGSIQARGSPPALAIASTVATPPTPRASAHRASRTAHRAPPHQPSRVRRTARGNLRRQLASHPRPSSSRTRSCNHAVDAATATTCGQRPSPPSSVALSTARPLRGARKFSEPAAPRAAGGAATHTSSPSNRLPLTCPVASTLSPNLLSSSLTTSTG